jgi:hypothetical protein
MELYKALKHIVQTDGKDALLELRLVNILDDFKAYEDTPSAKYILRAIIADGCMQKLLQAGAWNAAASQLSQKFASTTGFMPETVELIFQSIAYGLDWIQKINIPTSTPTQKYSQPNCSSWHPRMTNEEKNQFLLSLVEIEHESEQKLGVTIQGLSFDVDSDNNFQIFCELVNNRQKQNYAFNHIAIYDLAGRIKYTDYFGSRQKQDIKVLPVSIYIDEIKPDNISKIRVWLAE